MQNHYLLQITKALPDKDYERFCGCLKADKKDRSLTILKSLRRCDKTISKEDLYEKVFKTKHQAEKDFLIRNEFRLLKKLVEDYLLQKEIEREVKENEEWRNKMLGNAMVQLQLPGIASNYLRTAMDAARQNLHHDLAFELNLMTFPLEYLAATDQEAVYGLLKRSVVVNKSFIDRGVAFRTAQVDFQISLLNRIGKELGKKPIDWDVLFSQNSSETPPEALYYQQKTKAYTSYSIADMEVLFALAKQLPENPLTRNERITAMVQLASVCSIYGQFERATNIFEQAYQSKDFAILKEKPSFYINYITNLVKLKQYETALKIIHEAELLATGANLRNKLDAARITCYIFLKNTEQLKELLPNDFSEMDEKRQYYYKLLYAIYFYLGNQIEMALRELDNLLHVRQINNSPEYVQLIKLMGTVFRLLQKEAPLGKPHKNTIAKVQQIIKREKETLNPDMHNLLPFLWLEGL